VPDPHAQDQQGVAAEDEVDVVGCDGPYSMNALTPSPTPHSRRRRPKARRVPVPRVWPVTADDIYFILGGNALLILGMWIRHGGLNLLITQSGIFTALGEISALYGTYLVLIQLI